MSAESAEIQMRKLTLNEVLLLGKSRSIHLLEKVRINITPELLDRGSLRQQLKEIDFADNEYQEDKQSVHDLTKMQRKLNQSESVEYVEYAPRLFYHLRQLDKINSEILQESFSPVRNKESAFEAGESQGKSGSFFFFTHDRKFLIKTMTHTEYEVFMNFLPHYYLHCVKHRRSLLARVYGVFRLQLPGLVPLYFFMMENCLRFRGTDLLGIYDLKGSRVNREVPVTEITKPSHTLKDINFLERKRRTRVRWRVEW
jgi:1-phosphatidylinositol-4-phosphate 5-kinase